MSLPSFCWSKSWFVYFFVGSIPELLLVHSQSCFSTRIPKYRKSITLDSASQICWWHLHLLHMRLMSQRALSSAYPQDPCLVWLGSRWRSNPLDVLVKENHQGIQGLEDIGVGTIVTSEVRLTLMNNEILGGGFQKWGCTKMDDSQWKKSDWNGFRGITHFRKPLFAWFQPVLNAHGSADHLKVCHEPRASYRFRPWGTLFTVASWVLIYPHRGSKEDQGSSLFNPPHHPVEQQ